MVVMPTYAFFFEHPTYTFLEHPVAMYLTKYVTISYSNILITISCWNGRFYKYDKITSNISDWRY